MKKVYTKLEAAQLQLDEAIRLYFEERDPVSIHTLAGAARGVLHDLSLKKGITPIEDRGLDLIKLERRDEARRLIFRKHRNYFKHADKDPDEENEFNDLLNEYEIMLAIEDFRELTDEVTPEMDAFMIWVIAHHPNLLRAPETPELIIWRQKIRDVVQGVGRKDYLDAVLDYKKRQGFIFWKKGRGVDVTTSA